MRRAAAAWERFWFREESTSTLALLRIAFATVTLAWAATLAPDLEAFYGAGGVANGSRAASAILAVLVVAAGCLLVGYRTRLAAAAVLGCLVWFDHVNDAVLNSGDVLLRNLAFFLVLAPAGACLSVDALRRGPGAFWESPRRSAWAIRLIQLQVSIMYLAAVAWKLQGAAWRDGTAVSYPLRLPGIAREPLPDWIAASPDVVHLLTWGTLALELSIGILVWVRWARPWVLGAGIAFHLSIQMVLAPGFFSWAVLVAYVAFVPPERASQFLRALRRALCSGLLPADRSPGSPPVRRF